MVSTKGRYALRVLIDLSEQGGGGAVPLKEIAERQEISKKYLEIIVKELVRGGYLTGTRGKGGGYQLCRKPEEYNVEEILEFMEGSLAPVACLAGDTPPCSRAGSCRTLPMWKEYEEMMRKFFSGRTIADLANLPEKR